MIIKLCGTNRDKKLEEDEVSPHAQSGFNLDLKKWAGFELGREKVITYGIIWHKERCGDWSAHCMCLRKLNDKPE